MRYSNNSQPASLDSVRAKARGVLLSQAALSQIIDDIAGLRYSPAEVEAFLLACAKGMSPNEVLALTRAMADAGNHLRWPGERIVDIHSVGGIPGNRVSMIVVPIIAAHGMTIPKTASRAITTPAGTADTMEVLARVDLSLDEIGDIVGAENGCLVWGGRAKLSPADDILIAVERSIDLDAPGQLVASILSKKLAAGVTHLLIELPLGPATKLPDEASAKALCRLFEFVAARTGLIIETMITSGSAPVGHGIGPVLEARDVMKVLRGKTDAPRDLRARAIAMAGRLLEFDSALRGCGIDRARELLESGAALRKMERILAAQGRPVASSLGKHSDEIVADNAGMVAAIDCSRISHLARTAGAPDAKGAGIDLIKKVGDPIAAGTPLYRIYAETAADLRFACEKAIVDNGYRSLSS